MADPSADNASYPEKIAVRESKKNEEAAKLKKDTVSASYDPRKLYMRGNIDSKNAKESSFTGNAEKSDEDISSDTKKHKIEENEDSDLEDIDDIYFKRRKTGYLMIPKPKKYLIGNGGCSTVLTDQKTKSEQSLQTEIESSSSNQHSDKESDTELSCNSSFHD